MLPRFSRSGRKWFTIKSGLSTLLMENMGSTVRLEWRRVQGNRYAKYCRDLQGPFYEFACFWCSAVVSRSQSLWCPTWTCHVEQRFISRNAARCVMINLFELRGNTSKTATSRTFSLLKLLELSLARVYCEGGMLLMGIHANKLW